MPKKKMNAKERREMNNQQKVKVRQQKQEDRQNAQETAQAAPLERPKPKLEERFPAGKKAPVHWEEPFQIYVEALSPIHLGSGKGDVTVDAEVVHDAVGLPYFPAKRFKGLLYESALEVVEIMGGTPLFGKDEVKALFRHGAENQKGTQLIVPNLYLENHETMRADWAYLQKRYGSLIQPQDVLEQYTSLRYQTKIDLATGMAADTSLHNMRVVDKGIIFVGNLTIKHGGEAEARILALALRNLESAGLKRNRGFGRIHCVLVQGGKNVGSQIVETALKAWKEA